ncbi:putative thiamine pyrophosphokinase protein [Phaeoacremonium minimum UCRPA7]|uniref:Thiamine pyrophosphokinase n=1 Tax=Phaeoacremonium minimum (strain UCR-PA7) TaxID=1286976 RepID=R8BM66_PHAM7|nr:putative thiamine pyrophosphokinase protein [Phaeoacremonium minimum UCRPA7]EOO00449.1 putative thiamine pyrophosphokinase protein [Phaeoacremonium minimum UCRPA7]
MVTANANSSGGGGAAAGVIEWHPAGILQDHPATTLHDPAHDSSPFALVILNQPLREIRTLERLWKNCATLDSDDLDVIIGDLDSLDDHVRQYYASDGRRTEIKHIADQYSTDFAKAVAHIRSTQPRPVDIVAMGGLGGRVDQGLSQLHHLYLFQEDPHYIQGRMFLLSGESLTFLLKKGMHRIHVRNGREEVFGKYVGIIPVKEPSIISTKGLEWDVTDWKTEFGGLISTSNHVLPETEVVEIKTATDVLFTIALKQS